MVKLILIDFWGTLAENGTYSPLRQTHKMFRVPMTYSEFVQAFEETAMLQSFSTLSEAVQHSVERIGARVPPFIIERIVGVWNTNWLVAQLYPDTIQFLQKAKEKGILVAVAANSPSHTVEKVIDKYELTPYFAGVFLSCNEGALKTGGQLYLKALETLGVKAEDAIVVGDSVETDIIGAEKAGIKAYLLDRNGRREHPNKITTLNDLPLDE